MYHEHHIIPRHMGGGNEPSNLVKVSVEEHAELHLALYLEYGKLEDWYAYNALSGKTEESERARRLLLSRNMKGNTRGRANKGRKNTWTTELNKTNNPMSGKHWITNGSECIVIPISSPIPEGWFKGRIMSEESKKKMSISAYKRSSK